MDGSRNSPDSQDVLKSRNFAAFSPEVDGAHQHDPNVFCEELFNALFPANSLYRASLARTKQDGMRLRIRLSNDIPELSNISWEFTYDPVAEKHVAVRTPLVRHARLPGEAGVKLCLVLGKEKMWWKGLGFGGTPTPKLAGEGQGSRGWLTTVPGEIEFHFWKAKMFGVHTPVGKRMIDLSRYNEHAVTFSWLSD